MMSEGKTVKSEQTKGQSSATKKKGEQQWRGSTAAFSAVIHPHEQALEEAAVSLARRNAHILPEVQCHNNDERCTAIISLAHAHTHSERWGSVCSPIPTKSRGTCGEMTRMTNCLHPSALRWKKKKKNLNKRCGRSDWIATSKPRC